MQTIASMPLSGIIPYIKKVMIPRGSAAAFRGPPGMGKTKSLVIELRRMQDADPDFGGCMYVMANAESIDVRGFFQMSDLVSQYAMPPWLFHVPAEGLRGAYPALCPEHLRGDPKTWSKELAWAYDPKNYAEQLKTRSFRSYKRGVIVLDEFLQTVEETVQLPMAQLFNEHRVGMWGVPMRGWAIVGLTNRITDQAGAREMYAHLRDRLAVWDTGHDPEGCNHYWRSIGVNQYFRHFAATEERTIFTNAVPNSQDQFTTPRSWHYAHDDAVEWLVNEERIDREDMPNYLIPADHEMVRSMIASRCGVGTAARFSDFLQHMTDRPSFKSIVANPRTAKLPSHSAVIRAVVEMCVDNASLDEGKENLDQVCRYMEREEMALTSRAIFCRQLFRRFAVTTLYQHDAFLHLIDTTGPAARNALLGKKGE
jgi:hypothetical protein